MLSKVLQKKIEKELDKKIDLKKNFIQNNLDSLDVITLISLIEDEFKIRISEQKLKKINSFKDLSNFVNKS
jgi:acyl carrier protein